MSTPTTIAASTTLTKYRDVIIINENVEQLTSPYSNFYSVLVKDEDDKLFVHDYRVDFVDDEEIIPPIENLMASRRVGSEAEGRRWLRRRSKENDNTYAKWANGIRAKFNAGADISNETRYANFVFTNHHDEGNLSIEVAPEGMRRLKDRVAPLVGLLTLSHR